MSLPPPHARKRRIFRKCHPTNIHETSPAKCKKYVRRVSVETDSVWLWSFFFPLLPAADGSVEMVSGHGGEGGGSVGRRRETRPNESGAKRQCLLEAAEAEAHFGEGQCVCWCVQYTTG